MSSSKYPNLGFDPAPGDLETVRLLVAAVGTVSREGGDAQTRLSKIGTSDGVWVGKSANAFSDSVAEIPPYLKKALGSMDSAHRALSSWQTELSAFQTRALKLEQDAADAASRVSAAKGKLDGVSNDTSEMSDKEKEDHQRDKKGKQAAYDTANDELDAVRSRARTLNSEFTIAADDAARQIKDAADDAPPEPGWFEDLIGDVGDFLADFGKMLTDPNFWKLVGDILADIAMVIGIICLFAIPFGGIAGLALVGLLVGAGALAAHSVALAGGAEGMTWEVLAWDAAGVLAGGIGLAGSKLAVAGRALVQSGRGLRATSGLMATLGRIGPGGWSNIAKIPSGVANSVRGFGMSAKGWQYVATGKVLDVGMTVAGASFALGSNWNDARWTDGDWNVSDVPVVGPVTAIPDYEIPEPDVMAPGPVGGRQPQLDVPATLTSAGTSFTKALEPAQFGAVA